MKKYIFIGASKYTEKILSLIPSDDVECILDGGKAGEELGGKKIYANFDVEDLPRILENYEFVLMQPSIGDVRHLRENLIPFIFSAELLLRYKITDLDLYPYPIKYLLNTYGKKELIPPTEEEKTQYKEWENKYKRFIIGVVHPTAIGAFCWTYGRFAEFVEANKRDDDFVGICKGWHPVMETIKKYEVPNEYFYKKFLETYPSINEENVNFVAGFLCCHLDKLNVFDYTDALEASIKIYRQTLNDPDFKLPKFPPKTRINFSAKEQEEGAKLAHDMGIWTPYVCFSCRDNAYLKKTHKNITEESYEKTQKTRNGDINTFNLMTENLMKMGIQSVRMGSVVEKEYKGIGVDYSTIGRSEFMDAYLFSHSLFNVMYDSGIGHIPYCLFSSPSVFIAPPYVVAYHRDNFVMLDRIIYFLPYSEDLGKHLTLREVLSISKSLDFDVYRYRDYWLNRRLYFEAAKPEDIWEVAREMVNLQNGTQKYSPEDAERQETFQRIVKEYIGDDKRIGGTIGRVGAAWLKKYQWYIE